MIVQIQKEISYLENIIKVYEEDSVDRSFAIESYKCQLQGLRIKLISLNLIRQKPNLRIINCTNLACHEI